MKVDRKRVVAMVDTVATHTFVEVKIAAKIGLKLKKSPFYVQTVSSKAQTIADMTVLAYFMPPQPVIQFQKSTFASLDMYSCF